MVPDISGPLYHIFTRKYQSLVELAVWSTIRNKKAWALRGGFTHVYIYMHIYIFFLIYFFFCKDFLEKFAIVKPGQNDL